MQKVLVIRKPDRTIHQVPLENKATLMAFNNRLPAGQKWVFEEVSEEAAAKLPFVDPNYITAADAVSKVKALENENSDKDQKIKELEARLAALNIGNSAPESNTGTDTNKIVLAKPEDVIAKINAANDEAGVKEAIGTDVRKAVIAAAEKKITSFTV